MCELQSDVDHLGSCRYFPAVNINEPVIVLEDVVYVLASYS